MTDDTQPSIPKRIGGMPLWMQRRKDQIAARSEREELVERMRGIINEDRVRGGFKPYDPMLFAIRLKQYTGSGTSSQKLSRIYQLEGKCKEAADTGFGYCKCFEVEVKNAKKFKQQKLI